ncbi:MAG TPA: hypothetical protein VNH17_16190, partial [Streptosporangiaceae bacterium]|nr:hypothetical protein [Streptosporangiaceae bacterium]
VGTIAPARANMLDCSGYSPKYRSAAGAMRMRCTDFHGPLYDGYRSRFYDNGKYVGHDEPSVKFISHKPGSGNTMSYLVKLPVDPKKAATPDGKVTKYGELSIAPWFGLPMCDPQSYPQNPCTPDSDTNTGLGAPTDAGSAFMELQFYAPGFTPFASNISCDVTKWCARLTIDSLAATFNFAFINPACTEPVNAAFLQRNGVPTGPPSPQLSDLSSFTPNAQTLMMNPGDVLKVSITDPAAGFTTRVTDLNTGQTGFMTASAANGFMNTNVQTCDGTPFTFHAEYNTAAQENQVPWAALEGGVLMQQEIGHFETCNSVANQFPISFPGFSDPQVFQTCMGGSEGKNATGEGPCNPNTGICQNATTEGVNGPVACPTNDAGSGALCEFSDGECINAGTRTVLENGVATTEHMAVTGCLDNLFQNGDLDFDGTDYQARSWPDGSANTPTAWQYLGPFGPDGRLYPQIQFETNAPASESLCNTTTGVNCVVKPLGSDFYPFWSMNNRQFGQACTWNFGNVLPVTRNTFGKTAQYGTPDLARFGGTLTSPVQTNPALQPGCGTGHR